MLEATLYTVSIWKKLFKTLCATLKTANFVCTLDGIKLERMDTPGISLTTLYITKDAFAHYTCQGKQILGIDIESMSQILECIGDDDMMTLSKKENTIDLEFKSLPIPLVGSRISKFSLALVEIDVTDLDIPPNDHVLISIPSLEFSKICKQFSKWSDEVIVTITADSIDFKIARSYPAKADIMGNTTLPSSFNDDIESKLMMMNLEERTAIGKFRLKKLKTFTSAQNLSPFVNLSLSTNQPLMVEYPIKNFGHVRYYIAPMV